MVVKYRHVEEELLCAPKLLFFVRNLLVIFYFFSICIWYQCMKMRFVKTGFPTEDLGAVICDDVMDSTDCTHRKRGTSIGEKIKQHKRVVWRCGPRRVRYGYRVNQSTTWFTLSFLFLFSPCWINWWIDIQSLLGVHNYRSICKKRLIAVSNFNYAALSSVRIDWYNPPVENGAHGVQKREVCDWMPAEN